MPRLATLAPRPAPVAPRVDRPAARPAGAGATIGWLVLATFVVILNETTMANALPALVADLGVSTRAGQWLSTSFMLTMATVIPASGWLLKRLSTRVALGTAMGTFCGGTLLCALAPTYPVLLAGRVVQATGTAVMLPLTLSAVMTLVAPERRGRVMGRVTMAIAVAPAMGPTLAGVVLDVASWRWIFGLVLPAALGATAVALGKVGDHRQAPAVRLDVASLALVAPGLAGLLYGLSLVGTADTGRAVPVVLLGLGLLLAFARRQRRLEAHGTPLLDLRTLGSRRFVLGFLLVASSFLVMIGATITLTLYLQGVLHLSALQAGVAVMPGGVAMALLSPVAGARYDALGVGPLVVPGAALILLGLGVLAGTSGSPGAAVVVAGLTVLMLGCAAIFTPAMTGALAALSEDLRPHGSSLLATTNQAAAALGTALVVTVLTSRTDHLTARGATPEVALAGGAASAVLALVPVALGALGLAVALARTSTTSTATEVAEIGEES